MRLSFDIGAATHQAQRDVNEDRAVVGSFPAGAYAVVCDGVGGEPWGDVAAATACNFAEGALVAQLQAHVDLGTAPDLSRLLNAAFHNATKGLQRCAVDKGYRFGLKTTLIVAVVWRDQLAWGYVGDGGLWVHGGQGIRSLLNPMTNAVGELAAVVSPWRTSEPCFGQCAWPAGGVLLAATDGLSEPVPLEGIAVVANEISCSESGSVQVLLEQLLDACNGQVDDLGPIFNDNMGIAALRHMREG